MSLSRIFRYALTASLFISSAAPALAQKAYDDPVLERMRADIFYLAGPECEGRGVGTAGIDRAADHIAAAFRQAGLKPATKDGLYFQPFTIVDRDSVKLGKPTTATLTGPDGAKKQLELSTDYNPMGYSPTSKVSGARLAFVGYGITAPELNYDDYGGLDVAGKVVVMIRRVPRADQTGAKRFDVSAANIEDSLYASFVAKIDNAIAHKAAGVVIVNDTESAGRLDSIPQFANHARDTAPASFPVLFFRRATLNAILENAGRQSIGEIEKQIDADLKPRSFAIPGWTLDAQVMVDHTDFQVKNVVGVLEGSGPLADETVVLGAHYDHLGYGGFGSMEGAKGKGKVHYGADDNASGTTTLIELARRFGAMKNRQGRRLVFIAFSGEERGLFGSIHYCKHPLFPLEKTVAMINMDMVGRAKLVPNDWLGIEQKDRLLVYGTGTADEFPKLVNRMGEKADFKLGTLAMGSGPSDHDSFYRKRIPVLFLYTGTHGEYHRPTDVPEKINVLGMKKVADFVQDLTAYLSTVAERPRFQATPGAWSDPTEKHGGSVSGSAGGGPRLGIRPGNYESEEGGVLVDGVSPGGPAEKGGVQDGDVIVQIGDKPVKNITGYMTAMKTQKAGALVEVVVLRKGQKVTLKLTPE